MATTARGSRGSTIYNMTKLVMEKLFEAEARRLNKTIETVLEKQRELSGQTLHTFFFEGILFRPESTRTVRGGIKSQLHPSLEPIMEAHMVDVQTIEDDKKQIEQLMFIMLQPCTQVQEARDALPDCLSRMIPELAKLERRYEEAWSIKTDRRAMQQYDRLMPRIQMYAAARMLY